MVSRKDEANSGNSPQGDIELGITGDKFHVGRESWNLTHSFYVLMGGFVFDTSDLAEDKKFLPMSRDQLTLSPEAFRYVAEYEPLLLDIPSESEIWDKSKANGLTKLLICTQATWFTVQVIFRLVQGFSISPLELNTVAHTLCALLAYGFWWQKLLEIERPTIIRGENMQKLCALMCYLDYRGHEPVDTEPPDPNCCCKVSEAYERSLFKSLCVNDQPSERTVELYKGQKFGRFYYTNYSCRLHGGPCRHRVFRIQPEHIEEHIEELTFYFRRTIRDQNRWKLASDGWEKYKSTLEERQSLLFQQSSDWSILLGRWRSLCWIRLRLRSFVFSGDSQRSPEMIPFTIAGLVYGTLHLLLWDGPFRSGTERLLWRVAAVTVAASGPAFMMALITGLMIVKWYKASLILLPCFALPLLELLNIALIAGTSLYIMSRLYMVVECFVSLPYLPNSSFKQPQWSYYFPHLI
ncbi:MAG: hypothetical protein Q9227_000962 [Pyrenula ochraceoflavens]